MTPQEEYNTALKLAEKIVANYDYTYRPLSDNSFRIYDKEKAEQVAKTGKELLNEMIGELKKAREMYSELTNIAQKYKCCIIVPTQPARSCGLEIPQKIKEHNDVIVIDYIDHIKPENKEQPQDCIPYERQWCAFCEYFDGYDMCLRKGNAGSITDETINKCSNEKYFSQK